MPAQPLPANLLDSPEWLVQAIDPRARLARLVRMEDADYRAASFLDDRMLSRRPESRLCSLDALIDAAGGVGDPPAGWIFHIGHVGSTLVSRLLGELDGVLAVREPRALRDLAVANDAELPKLAAAVARLMARRPAGGRATLVKASSFVSDHAPLLIAPEARALFLYATPQSYISGILAGENSLAELATLYPVRQARLERRGIHLHGFDCDNAHRAAAAWACEMVALEAAATTAEKSTIIWSDFDLLLRDPCDCLAQIAVHFGLDGASESLEQLAAGPIMRQYSKAPEYDYSPELRAELLAEAGRKYAQQIDAAIAALRNVGCSAPLLKAALERAGGEG